MLVVVMLHCTFWTSYFGTTIHEIRSSKISRRILSCGKVSVGIAMTARVLGTPNTKSVRKHSQQTSVTSIGTFGSITSREPLLPPWIEREHHVDAPSFDNRCLGG